MAGIALEGVTKVYPDGTVAVRDLDLELRDGEFTVLVGPSGCGKTTGLLMVAGLEEVSSGTISIGDRVVNEVPPKDRDVAMVFQNYALYPHMSVFDNMAFSLKVRRLPRSDIERRVNEAARILGLSDLLARRPKALSGGQRQRVAMGRAIVREPQAFLMDEPLSNLDAKLRVQMRAEIARIQADLGVTTMYVTHDQIEAMTMGNRVAVLKRGLLQQVDAPQELYDRPANLFVAGFIGSPAMNMVDARLARANGRIAATFGSHRLAIEPRVLALHPTLSRYEGRSVIIGIRPEHMQEASLMPEAPTEHRLVAPVDLREALGSEILVHFSIDAPPVLTEDTKELARDLGTAEDLQDRVEERTSTFVAKLDPRTRAEKGHQIELVVDTSRMHFFDPETGLAIRGG